MGTLNKHFKKYDRDMIEKLLDNDSHAKTIAIHLGKSERSVSYEVKHHRCLYNGTNACYKANKCQLKNICWDCPPSIRYRLCKNCKHRTCSDHCEEVAKDPICKRLTRFPYVCNACKSKDKCRSPKYYYKSQRAEETYEFNVTDWKKGPAIPLEDYVKLDEALSIGSKNGHSITSVLKEHNLDIHPSTVYRYVHDGYLSTHEIDLPYQVRYKARKKTAKSVYKVNYDYLNGRRHEDFAEFISSHPGINIWQMDTVEGIKGESEPCLLTLLYVPTNLQLYFKLPAQTVIEVNKAFSYIKNTLGAQLFSKTFSVILTDNGSEFKDPLTIETDEETGEKLINVFYCHPRRSDEKAKAERNHKELRRMVPQGISWKPYTQQDLIYISNNVNNYYRPQFNSSPYKKSLTLLDEKVFKLNQLKYIPPENVFINSYIKK